MNLCDRCGRDLGSMAIYADFVHFRADREGQIPCLALSDFYKTWLDAEEAYLNSRWKGIFDGEISE